MGIEGKFSGFSPKMTDFLFELRFNNTIEKQADNIVKYKKLISEPLVLLYNDLLSAVTALGLPVETRPARCLSTPYTDRRFSPTVPLKEYMYIRFKQGGKKSDVPGLYFDMGMEHYGYGIRVYKQTARGMEALRGRIGAAPEKFSAILDDVMGAGFEIKGEKFKKDHFPDMPDCAAKEILNRRGFYIEKAVAVGKNVFSSALSDELSAAFELLSGIYEVLARS